MSTVRSEFRIGLKDETRAGVQSVNRSLDELNKSAARAGAALAGLGVGLLAGVGASAAQVVNLGDKLRDLSFATGNSVEQLSFLDFAAKQSGTSIETIATASQRLAKNLTEVSRGGGKAAAVALQELGLSAEELARLDLVSQIETIGQALQRIDNPAQRAAAGAALFGKQFKELAPLVLDTSNSFGELAARFVELGGTLTREQADAFDALNDSIGELQLSVRQAGEALATVLSPSLSGIATAVADFVNNIGPALTSRFFDIKAVLLDASRAVQKSKLDFVEFFNVFGLGDESIEATKQRIAEITREIELVRDAQQGVIDDRIKQREQERAAIGQALQGGELDTTNTADIKAREKAAKDLARAEQERFRVYNAAVDETLRQIEEEARQWEELDRRRQAVIEANLTPLEKQLAKLKEIKDLVGDTGDTYGRAAIDAFNELNPEIDLADEKAKKLKQTFADLGATFTSAFEDAILNGERFSDVLGGLAKDIARLLLRETVSNPLAKFFSDSFGEGGFLGGLFKNDRGGLYRVAGSGGGERPIAFTAKAGEYVAVGTSMQQGGGEIQVINIGAAPQRVERRQVNGKRQVMQFFSSTAADATSEGALLGLGIAPPLVAR